METAIIASKLDPAGLNIKQALIDNYSFKELKGKLYDGNKVYSLTNINIYTINNKTISAEDIDKEIEADLFIFISKHSSKEARKTLSVHMPGNWGKAELGGKDKTLNICNPSYFKEALLELKKLNNLDYEVTGETDHHGPYLEKPCFFIEVGSQEEQWNDKKAAFIITNTLMNILQRDVKDYRVALGIGGNHYMSGLNKIQLETDIALSHICPKHYLKDFDEKVLYQAIVKSTKKPSIAIIDWKGLGSEKQRVIYLLKDYNLEVIRSDRI